MVSHEEGGSGPSYITGWLSAFTCFDKDEKFLGGKREFDYSYDEGIVTEFPLIGLVSEVVSILFAYLTRCCCWQLGWLLRSRRNKVLHILPWFKGSSLGFPRSSSIEGLASWMYRYNIYFEEKAQQLSPAQESLNGSRNHGSVVICNLSCIFRARTLKKQQP